MGVSFLEQQKGRIHRWVAPRGRRLRRRLVRKRGPETLSVLQKPIPLNTDFPIEHAGTLSNEARFHFEASFDFEEKARKRSAALCLLPPGGQVLL